MYYRGSSYSVSSTTEPPVPSPSPSISTRSFSDYSTTREFLTELGDEIGEWRDMYGGANKWLEMRSNPEAELDGMSELVWDKHLRRGERLRMRLTEGLFSVVAPAERQQIQDCWTEASDLMILVMHGINSLSFELY